MKSFLECREIGVSSARFSQGSFRICQSNQFRHDSLRRTELNDAVERDFCLQKVAESQIWHTLHAVWILIRRPLHVPVQ